MPDVSHKLLSFIHYLIAGCIVLSLLMFFLAENGRANAFPTYLLAIGVLIALPFSEVRSRIAAMPGIPLVLAIALIEYLAISAWWSDHGSITQVFRHQGYALLILVFVLSLNLASQRFDRFLDLVLGLTIAAATVSAVYSIYLHFALPEYQPLHEPRLYGLGRLSNPVISAVSYGFATILAAHLLIQRQKIWQRSLLGACVLLLLIAIALAGTRTAWLALGIGVGAGLAMRYRERGLLLFAGVLFVTGVVAVAALGWEDLAKRGLSFRPEIWAEFIGRSFNANPILGAGSGSNSHWVSSIETFKHPHSIFISAFFFGGIIGLVLLIGLFTTCARHLYLSDDSEVKMLAVMTLSYGVTVGIFDGDNVLTKIDYLWWVVWFPVGVTLCVPARRV
ncbi:MAG: O-antigen ligase family protein [Gammaproteobacteria bacterium]|nr:O-antigen ligase family protein [Gammaproteobacteria bacterium]MBT7369230.1 O-antigen ligase family protein [Gammaproteobacteria bacterium]